ncbi:substrate-binding domain-containing protein [Bradyrhizobium sp. AUGA SZCCT0160]|nr:substrate-binding domain-containing protein [Bradyrhizobium sp. AUGA SZCCT0160]MBR1188622.1 substrate-binding domain-containing protein [Bradyrhizobium sp. AUGA SZCCT0160]
MLLHAAGSLRGALSDVAASFEAATGTQVKAKFGASGLLKDEIAGSAKAEVFASANMEHPRALAFAKRSGPAVLFARNKLCALARPGLAIEPATLLDRMLDAEIKLDAARRPVGRLCLGSVSQGRQDQTGRLRPARQESAAAHRWTDQPAGTSGPFDLWQIARTARRRHLPELLHRRAGGAEGKSGAADRRPSRCAGGRRRLLTVINDASAPAYKFALFILSTEGQQLLAKHGFAAPGAAP